MYAAVMSSMEPMDHASCENETLPVNIQFWGFRDKFHVACVVFPMFCTVPEPETTLAHTTFMSSISLESVS